VPFPNVCKAFRRFRPAAPCDSKDTF